MTNPKGESPPHNNPRKEAKSPTQTASEVFQHPAKVSYAITTPKSVTPDKEKENPNNQDPKDELVSTAIGPEASPTSRFGRRTPVKITQGIRVVEQYSIRSAGEASGVSARERANDEDGSDESEGARVVRHIQGSNTNNDHDGVGVEDEGV